MSSFQNIFLWIIKQAVLVNSSLKVCLVFPSKCRRELSKNETPSAVNSGCFAGNVYRHVAEHGESAPQACQWDTASMWICRNTICWFLVLPNPSQSPAAATAVDLRLTTGKCWLLFRKFSQRHLWVPFSVELPKKPLWRMALKSKMDPKHTGPQVAWQCLD